MPVVFSNPQFPLQAGPNGSQAYVQQLNFRQMINQVCGPMGNPDVDPEWAGRILNDAYREVVQRRNWYGAKVRGSINIPAGVFGGGQASVTTGSNLVYGTGTNWTTALIGQQFRIGFTYPYQTIYNVDPINQILTVDIPFGGQSITNSGFVIAAAYQTMGANMVRFSWAVNQQQGWTDGSGCACTNDQHVGCLASVSGLVDNVWLRVPLQLMVSIKLKSGQHLTSFR